jgi:hypothetical protein
LREFTGSLPSVRLDQKRLDAHALLEAIRSSAPP